MQRSSTAVLAIILSALGTAAARSGEAPTPDRVTAQREAPRWLAPAQGVRLASSPDGTRLRLSEQEAVGLTGLKEHRLDPRRVRYTAAVRGDPDSVFILSGVGKAWHGLSITESGWHEITGTGEQAGLMEVDLRARLVRHEAVPACGGGLAPGGDLPPSVSAVAQDRGTGITEYTLLACYTSQARQAAGGRDAIIARVLTAVELTNVIYERSGVDVRVRLVGTREVPADEDALGDFESNLTFFTAGGNSFYADAGPARDVLGADLMTLLIDRTELCGIAWLFTGSAYSGVSVCAWTCVGNTGTLAHEIGHNMGCAHDRENANSSTAPYGYGHRFTGQDGTLYRTLMAYAPGTRIARLSSPDVSWQGVPTGVPIGQAGEADNAQVIRDNVAAVAAFRTEEAPDANGNFVDDRVDIASGRSRDGNGDGVPDEVQSPILRVALPGDQGDWPDAITSVELAFNAAESDDSVVEEVRFARGVFPASSGGDASSVVLVEDGVRYLGGYDPETGERDPAATPTVITGDLLGDDDPDDPATRADNTRRIGEGYNLTEGTLLDGFHFRGAHAFGSVRIGAGFRFTQPGTVRLAGCTFTDLAAEFGDPAISINTRATVVLERCAFTGISSAGGGPVGVGENAALAATDCVFEGNASGFFGGAISAFAGRSIDLTRCTFRDNTAARGGGAVRITGGDVGITDCLFESNHAGLDGGAVHLVTASGDRYDIRDSVFVRNTGENGGAVHASGAARIGFARVRLAGNHATHTGGAVGLSGTQAARFDASLVLGNTAGIDGGGIGATQPGPSVTLASSVVASNTAGRTGGGIALPAGSSLTIDATTIYSNHAGSVGGLSSPDPLIAQLTGSIYWANTDAQGGGLGAQLDATPAGFAIVGANTVQDNAPGDGVAWPGAGNTDLPPRLRAAAAPGPDDAWGTADDEAGDWRPLPGSPITDRGDGALLLRDDLDLDGDEVTNERIPFGVDGRARIVGHNPDIGAAEAVPGCGLADLAEPFGMMDMGDVTRFVDVFTMGAPAPDPAADLNGDGLLDLADIVLFVTAFGAGC